jgi:hypothetical protein
MGWFNLLFKSFPERCREAMRQSYRKHYDLVRRGAAPVHTDPHHAGLFGALGDRYKVRGVLRDPAFPDVVLWAELTPFLLMSKEDSVDALAEYVLWQERPSAARKEWLTQKINRALSTKPSSNDSPRSLASLGLINNVSWCELLYSETRITLSREAEQFQPERAEGTKPLMNENLGRIVSEFVEKRVAGPQSKEVDLWCEAVYASLFGAAFEIVTRLDSAKGSLENLERETKAIIEGTCAHAAPWVNARLAEDTRQSVGVRVEWDLAPEMRNRVLQYFSVAYGAMADRGYKAEVARSHACFVILQTVLTQLGQQGLMGPDQTSGVHKKIFEGCESMSREMGERLDRYRK